MLGAVPFTFSPCRMLDCKVRLIAVLFFCAIFANCAPAQTPSVSEVLSTAQKAYDNLQTYYITFEVLYPFQRKTNTCREAWVRQGGEYASYRYERLSSSKGEPFSASLDICNSTGTWEVFSNRALNLAFIKHQPVPCFRVSTNETFAVGVSEDMVNGNSCFVITNEQYSDLEKLGEPTRTIYYILKTNNLIYRKIGVDSSGRILKIMSITSLQVNGKLDDSLFSIPKKIPELVITNLDQLDAFMSARSKALLDAKQYINLPGGIARIKFKSVVQFVLILSILSSAIFIYRIYKSRK